MRSDTYPVYAPLLVVEVLSPSNTPAKVARQRLSAFSGGTREFWVVDLDAQTVEVSIPGVASRVYETAESVPVSVLPDVLFPVRLLFEA